MATYRGSCHCGAVQFECRAPDEPVVYDCNCSMCTRAGFLHLIVTREDLRIIRGADQLTTYTFNSGVAKHTFCRTCGIKPFYVPRSNPDGYSINFRCLDNYPSIRASIVPFDGQHWEAAIQRQGELGS